MATQRPLHLLPFYFMGTWISVPKPSRGTCLQCTVGQTQHQMGCNRHSWPCTGTQLRLLELLQGMTISSGKVFLIQFSFINPSETVLSHLSLYTHDFRVLQTGTVQLETSGFHFEHSTICSEIQAVLLLWEGVWYVQPSAIRGKHFWIHWE